MQDERHPNRWLEEARLVPEITLAEQVAVIGGENDHGILGEPAGVEHRAQSPDLIIDIAHRAVVGMTCGPHL
jgi:hypothetical protein